jgi:hypothetical protein
VKRAVVAWILGLAIYQGAAVAQEQGVWFPREEAADLLGRAAEQATLAKKVEALEQQAALQAKIIETQARLVEIHERVAAGEAKLRELAERERDVYREKSERAGRGDRLTKAWAGAATGALIGTGIMPGIGTAGGAVVGGVLGFLAP